MISKPVTFELQHISKSYLEESGKTTVLHDINMQIEPGEFLAIMGPSGCGKSTLLRIIADFDVPTSGLLIGRPERIGFVFQSFGLLPWLTVEDNAAFGLRMQGKSEDYSRAVVRDLLAELGLDGLEKRHPKELSGGQKQRVGLARALAIEPELLLLDEPFSALDAITANELRSDIEKIWQKRGITIVMVTHLPSEAAMLSERIIVLTDGPGTVSEEIKNPLLHPRHERSTASYKLIDKLENLIR